MFQLYALRVYTHTFINLTYSDSHPPPPPPLAFATNAIIILHICWGVLFFDGFDQIKISGWPDFYIGLTKVIVVVGSHILISALVSKGM